MKYPLKLPRYSLSVTQVAKTSKSIGVKEIIRRCVIFDGSASGLCFKLVQYHGTSLQLGLGKFLLKDAWLARDSDVSHHKACVSICSCYFQRLNLSITSLAFASRPFFESFMEPNIDSLHTHSRTSLSLMPWNLRKAWSVLVRRLRKWTCECESTTLASVL